MDAEQKKRLILALLRDDLINTKLVLILNDAGLHADMYMQNLSSTIFGLMGFGNGFDTEAIYDGYRELAVMAQYIDISGSHAPLETLVTEIYGYLEQKSREL